MSKQERPLGDYRGRFARAVVDGRKLPDLEWVDGRILLSNRRLVLATDGGKRTIPLSEIDAIKSRTDAANPLAAVDSYVSVQVGGDVTLLSPTDHKGFESTLYSAILDGGAVLVDHPAVEGGVVRNGGWKKARLDVEPDGVGLALTTGQFVELEADDIGQVVETERPVAGDTRPVLEVEHTEDGTAVETHLAGPRRQIGLLAGLLRRGNGEAAEVDLTDEEIEVLVALYSGISPFRIPDFVGMDVDRVEEVYDDLVEQGILERRRTRREVELKARGRHIASEASGEE